MKQQGTYSLPDENKMHPILYAGTQQVGFYVIVYVGLEKLNLTENDAEDRDSWRL